MAKRVFLIVLDSFGVGGAPDAAKFGDEGSNTLAAVLSYSNAAFPNLAKMGLLAIDNEDDPRIISYKKAQESIPSPIGSYARSIGWQGFDHRSLGDRGNHFRQGPAHISRRIPR